MSTLPGLDLDNVDVRFRVVGKLRELLTKKLFDDEAGENGDIASAFVAAEVRIFVEKRMRALMGVKEQGQAETFTGDQAAFLRLLADNLSLDDIEMLCTLARHVQEGPPVEATVPAGPPGPPAARRAVPTAPGPAIDPEFTGEMGDDEVPDSIKIMSPSDVFNTPTPRGSLTKPMPQGRAMTEVTAMHAGESAEAGLRNMDKKFR